MPHQPLLLLTSPRKSVAPHCALPPWAQFDAADFQSGVNSWHSYIWKVTICGFDDDADIRIASTSHTIPNQANATPFSSIKYLLDTCNHASIRTSQARARSARERIQRTSEHERLVVQRENNDTKRENNNATLFYPSSRAPFCTPGTARAFPPKKSQANTRSNE